MIETIVSHLEKHEGVDVGSPGKALLLTDDDVDKWKKHMNDGWIPVEEWLPDEDGFYLVSLNIDIDIDEMKVSKAWFVEKTKAFSRYGKAAIAWQPLPDPYTQKKGAE